MAAVSRRHAREWALQLLFLLDANPTAGLDELFADFWVQQFLLKKDREDYKSVPPRAATAPAPGKAAREVAPRRIREFTEHLVRGVMENAAGIDAKLASYADNWTLPRMSGVDRNVLRLAFFELFFSEDAPPVVVINEAIDLAKYFSSFESGRFVNGILDRAGKDVRRPARARADGVVTGRSLQAAISPAVPEEYSPGRGSS